VENSLDEEMRNGGRPAAGFIGGPKCVGVVVDGLEVRYG
jgi:hypothetical protein